jgi:SAM-dependent methyltransferase
MPHSIVTGAPTDVDPALYNEEYFERGAITGVSGYMNYSWMPEQTLRMAHFIISRLPVVDGQKVLDFGCAKGFLVKALRILDVEAYGVDVSDYALEQVPVEVHKYCARIVDCADPACFTRDYDWMISKDVFEHIPEADLIALMRQARPRVKRTFAVIPLGADDTSGHFVVPDYDRDITHITARTAAWWTRLFEETGWKIDALNYSFRGVKENWTRAWPGGNAFFLLS